MCTRVMVTTGGTSLKDDIMRLDEAGQLPAYFSLYFAFLLFSLSLCFIVSLYNLFYLPPSLSFSILAL